MNFRTAATLIVAFLWVFVVQAQQYHVIDLQPQIVVVEGRDFYIDSVLDKREDTTTLGTVNVRKARMERAPTKFAEELPVALQQYFATALPPQTGQEPITISVKLQIKEGWILKDPGLIGKIFGACSVKDGEIAEAFLKIEFYDQEQLVFTTTTETSKKIKKGDVTPYHPKNIAKVLETAILEFSAYRQEGGN